MNTPFARRLARRTPWGLVLASFAVTTLSVTLPAQTPTLAPGKYEKTSEMSMPGRPARPARKDTVCLGEDDVRVFWDKTFVKPAATEGTRESVWHQDFPYNPIDRRGMLTIWVAIEDVPAEAGALRFVPGSHRLGPLALAFCGCVTASRVWEFTRSVRFPDAASMVQSSVPALLPCGLRSRYEMRFESGLHSIPVVGLPLRLGSP